MTSLLESVVQHGTGQRVKALNRPAAGKTGTTNDMYDAWYLGYTREYIAGTGVGFDEEAPLGKTETGAVAAIPIWLGFMKRVLANQPAQVFEPPEGVVFAKIDAETGLLPVPESRKTIFECFKDGTVPSEFTKRPGKSRKRKTSSRRTCSHQTFITLPPWTVTSSSASAGSGATSTRLNPKSRFKRLQLALWMPRIRKTSRVYLEDHLSPGPPPSFKALRAAARKAAQRTR